MVGSLYFLPTSSSLSQINKKNSLMTTVERNCLIIRKCEYDLELDFETTICAER